MIKYKQRWLIVITLDYVRCKQSLVVGNGRVDEGPTCLVSHNRQPPLGVIYFPQLVVFKGCFGVAQAVEWGVKLQIFAMLSELIYSHLTETAFIYIQFDKKSPI